MAQAGINVQLPLKEIYGAVCKKCKKKLRELIKEHISDQMVGQVIGGE